MGLGPNGGALAPRIKIVPIAQRGDEWMQELQARRTVARSYSQLKRREALAKKAKSPKGPKLKKPRKHKLHCYCIQPEPIETIPGLATSQSNLICCRCKGEKCVKPKAMKKVKKKTKVLKDGKVGSTTSISETIASAVDANAQGVIRVSLLETR